MSDKRELNLKLIQELGSEFMRSIKIHQNNKGKEQTFFIRPTIDGKVRYIAFKTEEDARLFLGLLPKTSTNPNKKAFIDHFYRAIDSIGSTNTKRTYHYTLASFESVTKKPISSIAFEELDQCFKSAKQTSWHVMNAVLKRICTISQDEQFNSLYLKLDIKNRYYYQSKKKNIEEPEKLINEVENFDCGNSIRLEVAKNTILLLCYTGMRIGELCALTSDDIKKDHVKINKTIVSDFSYSGGKAKTKTKVQYNTKGKVDRSIPLDPEIRELFIYHFELLEKLQRTDKKGIPRDFYSEKIRFLSGKIGIKVTPHLCRHAFGTIFGKACTNYDEVLKLKKLLGHKNLATTEKYITLSEPTSDDIMNKLPKLKKKIKK